MRSACLPTKKLACLGILLGAVAAAAPDYWPTDGWRTSTPEEQGMDSALLADALEFAHDSRAPLHSLLVVRNGYVVMDAYFHPFEQGALHDVASVTKSVTATLIGMAIDKGRLDGVDQALLPLFPDRTAANVDANKQRITLEHLLTMQAGLECVAEPQEVTLFEMQGSPDWVQFMLDLPMTDPPGARFVYNSGGVHLLSAVIRKTTGTNALAFARKNLFAPLGTKEVVWPTDLDGLDNAGWGSLRITPHAMAKLGYLYLNEGVWDGEQVLSAEWVKAATTRHVAFSEDASEAGYGYLWWLHGDVFAAQGRGGQRIFVVPDKRLVVVVTAGGAGQAGKRLLDRYIVPAVKAETPLSANPDGVRRLQAHIDRAAQAPAAKTTRVQRPPKPARAISGKVCALEPNPLGLRTVLLDLAQKQEATVRFTATSYDMEKENGFEFMVGLDGVPRQSPGRFGIPVVAKGHWTPDGVLAIDLDEVGNINRWHIRAAISGDTLDLEMRELTGLGTHSIKGRFGE